MAIHYIPRYPKVILQCMVYFSISKNIHKQQTTDFNPCRKWALHLASVQEDDRLKCDIYIYINLPLQSRSIPFRPQYIYTLAGLKSEYRQVVRCFLMHKLYSIPSSHLSTFALSMNGLSSTVENLFLLTLLYYYTAHTNAAIEVCSV